MSTRILPVRRNCSGDRTSRPSNGAANWVDIHVLSPINEEFIRAEKIVYGHQKKQFKGSDEK